MKRGWIIAAGAIVLAAVVVASIAGGGEKGEKVYVEPVERRDIASVVSAPGLIDPKLKVNISGHVIGKIDRLYMKEGDTVRKGMKLVELEKPVYQAQVDRMSAELRNRRIEVERAKINLENAELQLRRAERMRAEGIQADELFDRARLEAANARANLASAQEGVRQAEAALAQASEDLARTTIVAPIDGKVVQLNAQEGEVVITGTMNNPGSVIAVLADLSEILAVAEVTETEVVRVREGQPARVDVDAVSDKTYNGTVVEIGSSAATKAGAGSGIRFFNVKVAISDADERLRPGMTSQVEIVTESRNDVLAVPVQSVVERVPGKKASARATGDEEKKKYVFVVDGGKARMQEVTTGTSDASWVEITSGLTGGESVVSGPFRTLKKLEDGDAVRIETEEEQPKESEDEDRDDDDGRD